MTIPNGYVIGFKELYEMLLSLDQKLDSIVAQNTDHEARIKHLEENGARRWQTYVAWLGGGLGIVAGIVGGLFGWLH